jgi:hypothetical protein
MPFVLSAALALNVAAPPLPEPKPLHPAVLILTASSAMLMLGGVAFELRGRLEIPHGAPIEAWPRDARADVVGGVALLGTGLCLLTLAALVAQHRVPALVSTGGLGVRF